MIYTGSIPSVSARSKEFSMATSRDLYTSPVATENTLQAKSQSTVTISVYLCAFVAQKCSFVRSASEVVSDPDRGASQRKEEFLNLDVNNNKKQLLSKMTQTTCT